MEYEKIYTINYNTVIGDILFAIVTNSMDISDTLVFKFNRNNYLNKIRLYADINQDSCAIYEKYLILHKKLLIDLTAKNVFIKSEYRVLNKKIWTSTIQYRVNIKIKTIWNFPIQSEKIPFLLLKINNFSYIVGGYRNIWSVKRKKKEMEGVNIDTDSVIRASQISYMLSYDLYNLNLHTLNSDKNAILNELGCDSLDLYFKKYKKILILDLLLNLLLKKWSNQNENDDNDYFFISEESKNIKDLIKKFSKYCTKLMIYAILEKDIYDKKFYLPCFMDNRGRQYYGTYLSPTFHKIFRHLYIFEEKKTFLNLEESTYYNKIMQYKHLTKLNNKNDRIIYLYIVLLIEIGKFFIKKDDTFMIKTEDMIKVGEKMYTARKNDLNLENILYLSKLYALIDNLLENKIDGNAIIYKDATSSGLQNYGILLGYREDKLKYLNIDNEDWCDTYMYIVDKFIDEKYKNLKKRKYWKKTIMTIPYNAVWFSCYTKFRDELRKNGWDLLNSDEQANIQDIHKNFYNTIKNSIKNEFYINTPVIEESTEIKDILKKEFYENKNQIVEKIKDDIVKNIIEGGQFIWKYYDFIIVNQKEYKINYKKNRDKYTNDVYMLTIDIKATKNANEANHMHYLDAKLVKHVLKKYDVISIHDCFGIRLNELHLIMDEINLYYANIINKKTYSIHIIL